jgi:hypothetical protein
MGGAKKSTANAMMAEANERLAAEQEREQREAAAIGRRPRRASPGRWARNNSPSGIGVIFEHGDDIAHTGLVEDMDTIHMGNRSFSAAHARDITFRHVRARDNICGEHGGRGDSLSNSLMFASYANQLSYGIRYFCRRVLE